MRVFQKQYWSHLDIVIRANLNHSLRNWNL